MLFSDSVSDVEKVDIVPESQEPQPDSPAEDIVSVTLKRENSLRHSQRHAMRNGRFVQTSHAPNTLCQSINTSECMVYRNTFLYCQTRIDAKC